MAVLDDLAGLLVAATLGTVGVNLMLTRIPETPDTLIALMDYGGRARDKTHDGSVRRYPRIQVVTRAHDPSAARATAETVWQLFDGFVQQTIGGVRYEAIVPLSEPFPLDADLEGRSVIACNYEVRRG